jgi:hypothetical protein
MVVGLCEVVKVRLVFSSRPLSNSVADLEENFSGGQIHEWGLLFGKFKLFWNFSYKYTEILQQFKNLSGGQGPH